MPKLARWRLGVIVVAVPCVLAVASGTAHAASVRVSPSSGVNPDGQTISVSGSGFDPARNNKFGVYVVFGPRGSDWTTNANAYLAAKWVHTAASGSAGQAPMSASGTFSVSLQVKARYTDGDGKKVDCLAVQCYVITMAAHGVPDRSQDTFTPIRFTGAASGGSGGSGSSGNSGSSGTGAAAGSGSNGKSPTASTTPSSATPNAASSATAASTSGAGAFTQTATGGHARSPWPFWAAMAAAGMTVLLTRRLLRRRT